MKILVLNAGSSSLKLQIFTEQEEKLTCLYHGIIDRIGQNQSTLKENDHFTEHLEIKTHFDAIQLGVKRLEELNIIHSPQEISLIGHRVVHGGEKYHKATLITPEVMKAIEDLCSLAPLHNPPNLAGIQACEHFFPQAKQVAVFDTAFHQTMPPKAYQYALPKEYYQDLHIRRYGFHGISHYYLSKQTLQELKNPTESKIITCHLGNGSSITAIENGKSVDTSMGFTPLEGLPMGTRSGDLDPAIVLEIQTKKHLTPEQTSHLLNKESGLKALSSISSDIRDIWAAHEKNPEADFTLKYFAYKIAKYIGSYIIALKGLDAITFSGGIGENAWYVRQEIGDYLTTFGVELDDEQNKKNSREIQKSSSKIKVLVIPTNEELEIAEQTYQLK